MARDIAIDVHKRTLFVVAADAEGVELWHRRFATTLEEEAQLLGELGPEDRVVLESTCGVHRLANRIESTGAKVVVIDPQHCRLLGLRGSTQRVPSLPKHTYFCRPSATPRGHPAALGRQKRGLRGATLLALPNFVHALARPRGARPAPWHSPRPAAA